MNAFRYGLLVLVATACCARPGFAGTAHVDRPNIVGGGSIYTFVQNLLLSCTNEGLGSALTTLLAAEQPEVDRILGAPPGAALAALVAVGHPVAARQYTRLSRQPVEEFAFRDGFDQPW